jgi:GNAT superfamily N-acetyltransferase
MNRAVIRPCRDTDHPVIYSIINEAADAYRGNIPADVWHEPYMSMTELEGEIAGGVEFSGYELDGALVGVMGIQQVKDVDLIRHAYVARDYQGRGIGAALLNHLRAKTERPILIGTWAAATWAIRFYEAHGFELESGAKTPDLLRRYWSISDRQIELSVVLRESGKSFEVASWAAEVG